MFKNYLTLAWRNLKKHKFYTLVNMLGLALGLTAFIYIFMYVEDELSYDKYHPFAERTYRVDADGLLGDQVISTAQAGAPIGPTMKADFPEVEAFCRFRSRGSYLVKYEDRHFNEQNIIFVDSTAFQFFGISLLQGQPDEVLKSPNSIVLTEEMAQKYFGSKDPIGESLLLDNELNFVVTGVMEEIPSNTHFNYDFLLSLSSLEDSRSNQWGNMNYQTYVLLNEQTDVAAFTEKMTAHLVRNYFAPEVEQYIGMPWSDFLASGNAFDYSLFPLRDIHLYSAKEGEMSINGDIKYVWIFSLIGLFILIIACINFMNLSTARSAIRAREVGVRKAVGATAQDLVKQFLSESFLLSFLSLLLATGLVLLFLGQFNILAEKSFSYQDVFSWQFVVLAVGLTLVTSILAGSYPAFFLAKFKTVNTLRGSTTEGRSRPYLRNTLVVFQFLITVFLICGTLVVYKQLNFIQDKKLGFEREQLLMLDEAYALGDNIEAFKARMLSSSAVENATISGFLPVSSNRNSSSFFVGQKAELSNAMLVNNWRVDYDYVETMGMEVLQGRDFSTEFATDSMAVIINETMATYFEGDPIGQKLSNFGDNDELEVFKVIGVVQDFNYENLRQQIEPLAFFIGRSYTNITMRLRTTDLPAFINTLETTWNELAPGQPFSYSFMDERFNRMYETEQRIGNVIGVFAFLAIFIACIGLVGLSTFIAQQRSKEISIRKVLGASTSGLVHLLSKDFIKLVFYALVIAIPLSWWAMTKWLQSFAYRIELNLEVFLWAAIISLTIALLTVSFQSIRAAIANPVDSLRGE
jgi:putative ABC transport system permease protein